MSQPAQNLQPSFQLDLVNDPLPTAADAQCIGVADNLAPEFILSMAVDKGFFNICQRQGFEFDKELASSQTMIASPNALREFPVATILSPTNLTKESEQALMQVDVQFDSSKSKRPVLDQLIKSMVAKGLSQSLIEDVVSVADELYTNAIYNAPFVDMKSQFNPGVSRQDEDVAYVDGQKARMFMAHDDSRLVIGCEDPYGSLNLLRYMSKIRDTYILGPAATMNYGPGGAGLGSYIIFNAGSSLFFGVWPGKSTTLCCVVPLGMSYRRRVQMPKHLHWVQR